MLSLKKTSHHSCTENLPPSDFTQRIKVFKKIYCWIVIAVFENVFTYYCSALHHDVLLLNVFSVFTCLMATQCCLRHLVNIAVLKLSSSSRQCETGRVVALGWQSVRLAGWQVNIAVLIKSSSSELQNVK